MAARCTVCGKVVPDQQEPSECFACAAIPDRPSDRERSGLDDATLAPVAEQPLDSGTSADAGSAPGETNGRPLDEPTLPARGVGNDDAGASDAAMPAAKAHDFGDHELLEEIARGGMRGQDDSARHAREAKLACGHDLGTSPKLVSGPRRS